MNRYLVVTADDFGIGPETSRGILDLASEGAVTGTVLLVNSPYAEDAVRSWRRAHLTMQVGWHPCLTLDRPILGVERVPSLVGEDGRFWRLGTFLQRLLLRKIRSEEIEAELAAQYARFLELIGHPPAVVNSHHHLQVFQPVGAILRRLLCSIRPLPYLRRVREPWRTLLAVPGARSKRMVLSVLGRRSLQEERRLGFPGNDSLAGITDPACVTDPQFLERWLTRMPGRVVELTCHPGYEDATLIGRDCQAGDGQVERRVQEMRMLRHWRFQEACHRAHFTLVTPTELASKVSQGRAHAA